jgi:hypothetical protein
MSVTSQLGSQKIPFLAMIPTLYPLIGPQQTGYSQASGKLGGTNADKCSRQVPLLLL